MLAWDTQALIFMTPPETVQSCFLIGMGGGTGSARFPLLTPSPARVSTPSRCTSSSGASARTLALTGSMSPGTRRGQGLFYSKAESTSHLINLCLLHICILLNSQHFYFIIPHFSIFTSYFILHKFLPMGLCEGLPAILHIGP